MRDPVSEPGGEAAQLKGRSRLRSSDDVPAGSPSGHGSHGPASGTAKCTKLTIIHSGNQTYSFHDAQHQRKTRDHRAGERERSGDHSEVQGTSGENQTVFRDCRQQEPGTPHPRTEGSTSRTEDSAIKVHPESIRLEEFKVRSNGYLGGTGVLRARTARAGG